MTVELKVKLPVQRLRRQRGLSQEALARRAGVCSRTVYQAEAGRPVKPESALKLAAGLGLTLADVLSKDAARCPAEEDLEQWFKATGASESEARLFTGFIASSAPELKRYLQARGIL